MPIRPENRGRYPANLSEALSAFMGADELAAMSTVAGSVGVDVARTYQFWEAAVARLTGGRLTVASCAWDIEVPYGRRPIRVEVKYAQETLMRFQAGQRHVMKFTEPRGGQRAKAADVVVLMGIDGADQVHSWVAPAAGLRRSRSLTLTSPRVRTGAGRAGMDGYRCPPTQVLPEVLRAFRCHLHYDRDHHARTAAATRERERTAGMDPLFEAIP